MVYVFFVLFFELEGPSQAGLCTNNKAKYLKLPISVCHHWLPRGRKKKKSPDAFTGCLVLHTTP